MSIESEQYNTNQVRWHKSPCPSGRKHSIQGIEHKAYVSIKNHTQSSFVTIAKADGVRRVSSKLVARKGVYLDLLRAVEEEAQRLVVLINMGFMDVVGCA